jgi:hypothetical protein
MKNLFILFAFMTVFKAVWAQTDYSRSALSLVALNFNEKHNEEVLTRFSHIQIPEKFYSNTIERPVVKMHGINRPVRSELPVFLQYMSDDFIMRILNENKVAQQILAQWFNRQTDGTFNVDVLKQRGLYNASDNDFMTASASKRGSSTLMDMGLKLVNQSYVLVFDYYDMMTMDEYYTQTEKEPKDRTSNGFKVKVKSYLFRLDFSEEVAADFFKSYWINPEDSDKDLKIKAFDNAVFKWIPVGKQIVEAQSTQLNPVGKLYTKQKSNAELIDEMHKEIMEKVLYQIEARSVQLRVKALVSDVKPISAKIGKKEGLSFDQRYYVYENRMKKDSSINKRLIAVVKSMKVVDNRQVTSGHSDASQFYQIYGGRVDNMGMFMEQKNDIGLNLYFGNTFKGMQGFNGRMEFYISKFLGDLVSNNKSGKGLTSFKMYVEGGLDRRLYPYSDDKQDFTKVSIGIEKEFYPLSIFHIGPYLGYGIESTSVTIDDIKIDDKTDFLETGIRLGLNVFPRAQIIGSFQLNWLFSGTSIFEGLYEVIDLDYSEEYLGRGKPSISLGLRFSL